MDGEGEEVVIFGSRLGLDFGLGGLGVSISDTLVV